MRYRVKIKLIGPGASLGDSRYLSGTYDGVNKPLTEWLTWARSVFSGWEVHNVRTAVPRIRP